MKYLEKPASGMNVHAPPFIPIERPDPQHGAKWAAETVREGKFDLECDGAADVFDAFSGVNDENAASSSWPYTSSFPEGSALRPSTPEPGMMPNVMSTRPEEAVWSVTTEQSTARPIPPGQSTARPITPEESNSTASHREHSTPETAEKEHSIRACASPENSNAWRPPRWRHPFRGRPSRRPYIPRFDGPRPPKPQPCYPSTPATHVSTPNHVDSLPPSRSSSRPPQSHTSGPAQVSRGWGFSYRGRGFANRGRAFPPRGNDHAHHGMGDRFPFMPDHGLLIYRATGTPTAQVPSYASVVAGDPRSPNYSPSTTYTPIVYFYPAASSADPREVFDLLMRGVATDSSMSWTDIKGNAYCFAPLKPPTTYANPRQSASAILEQEFHTPIQPAASSQTEESEPSPAPPEQPRRRPSSPSEVYSADYSDFSDFCDAAIPNPRTTSKWSHLFFNPRAAKPPEQSRAHMHFPSGRHLDGSQRFSTGPRRASITGGTLNIPKKIDTVEDYMLMSYNVTMAMELFPDNIFEILRFLIEDLEWGKLRINAFNHATKMVPYDEHWSVTLFLEQERGVMKTLFGPEGPHPSLHVARELAAAKFINFYLLNIDHFPMAVLIFSPRDVPPTAAPSNGQQASTGKRPAPWPPQLTSIWPGRPPRPPL